METVDTPDISGSGSSPHCLIGDVVYVVYVFDDVDEKLYKLDMNTLTWSEIERSPTHSHEDILFVLGGEIYDVPAHHDSDSS